MAALWQETIDCMTPDRVVVVLISKDTPLMNALKSIAGFTADHEPWYDTHFMAGTIDAAVATTQSLETAEADASAELVDVSRLHIPAQNPYLPENVSLMYPPSATDAELADPSKLDKSGSAKLWQPEPPTRLDVALSHTSDAWFTPDERFAKPKAFYRHAIYSPELGSTAEASVLTRLLLRSLADQLREYVGTMHLLHSFMPQVTDSKLSVYTRR